MVSFFDFFLSIGCPIFWYDFFYAIYGVNFKKNLLHNAYFWDTLHKIHKKRRVLFSKSVNNTMPNHPSWNYQETIQKISQIPQINLQDFAKIGYLLGGRLTELLKICPENIQIKNGIIHTTINTLKTRKGKYIYREILNVINDEPFYCIPLIAFSQQKKANYTLEEYLEIGGKRNIQAKLKQEIGIVPHSLRHLRATHMGKKKIPSAIHQNSGPYLKHYFGWSNINMADIYIDKLTTEEIIEQYEKAKRTISSPPQTHDPIQHQPT